MADDRKEPVSSSSRSAGRMAAALEWLRPHAWWTWLVTLALFVVALQTAPEVLDFDAVAGGLLVVVAVAAAAPFGLIAGPLSPVAWLVSAGSALLISRTIPVLDDDPWPWPIVHGLVMLALAFSVAWRPPPNLNRLQQSATVIIVWAGSAALFGTSVPDRLRAGWIVGVSAVVVVGILLRWLGWLGLGLQPGSEQQPGAGQHAGAGQRPGSGSGATPGIHGGEIPAWSWLPAVLAAFREAFLAWVPSPPVGPPFAQRLLGRFGERAEWLRAALPWIMAIGVFWVSLASIDETLVVHDLVRPLLAALIAVPVGLARRYALLAWRLITVVAIVVAVIGTSNSEGLDPGTWPVALQWVWLAMTFLVALRHNRWTMIWVWLATVAILSAGATDDPGVALTLVVAASALVVIADLLRIRRLASHEVERQTELSELEKARRTVLEERARIARDLHDVVAHHMSMVVVQAETAPYRLPGLSVTMSSGSSARSTSSSVRSRSP